MNRQALKATVMALLALNGCSSDRSSSSAETSGALVSNGLPCPVEDVLARNCRRCHASPPAFGATMPLMNAEDLHAPSHSDATKPVFQSVGTRIHDAQRPMPPMGQLGPADMKVLDDWIAAGAPRSAATCTPTGTDGGTDALPCTPDHSLAPSHPWALVGDLNDEYVCYGVDVQTPAKRHAIAIGPRIQNQRVLHHLDVYEAPESFGSDPRVCSAFGSADWRLVFAWAPGGKNMVLPPEAGLPLSGTTHYVVQIHYSNLTHLMGETDASGIDMCTTDQLRPNDADVMAFGSDHFVIPPRANYDLTCRVAMAPTFPDLHLFAVMPHMHGYGKSLSHTLYPRGGAPSVDLATQANWDINNQTWFSINATVHPGDRLVTRCGWTNTTNEPVYFGDAAADEMCYAFTMYYPRITDPSWNWSMPASQSACTPPTPTPTP
jgi:hypothetical protein